MITMATMSSTCVSPAFLRQVNAYKSGDYLQGFLDFSMLGLEWVTYSTVWFNTNLTLLKKLHLLQIGQYNEVI